MAALNGWPRLLLLGGALAGATHAPVAAEAKPSIRAAALGDGRLAQKTGYDPLLYPANRNPKVHVRGAMAVRLDPQQTSSEFGGDDAYRDDAAGTLGLVAYSVSYRLDRDPVPAQHPGDARAAVIAGGMVFHDGLAWRGFFGPFTDFATVKPAPCFSKWIFLPETLGYRAGSSLPLILAFPRSHQRIAVNAHVVDGDAGGTLPQVVAAGVAIGCPADQGSELGYPDGMAPAMQMSPASSLPKRRAQS